MSIDDISVYISFVLEQGTVFKAFRNFFFLSSCYVNLQGSGGKLL